METQQSGQALKSVVYQRSKMQEVDPKIERRRGSDVGQSKRR